MSLRSIRRARGLTQKDLSDVTGLEQATISRAENMHKSAMLSTYMKCAEALGVTLADIFADERTALEQTLIGAFRRVPLEKHPMLFDLLRLAEGQTTTTAQPASPVVPVTKP